MPKQAMGPLGTHGKLRNTPSGNRQMIEMRSEDVQEAGPHPMVPTVPMQQVSEMSRSFEHRHAPQAGRADRLPSNVPTK